MHSHIHFLSQASPHRHSRSLATLLVLSISLLFLEDPLRKLGAPDSISLAKDVPLALAYFLLAAKISRRQLPLTPGLLFPPLLFLFWGTIEAFRPGATVSSFLLWFLNYLWYVPLFFTAPEALPSSQHRRLFLCGQSLIGSSISLSVLASAALKMSAPIVLQPIRIATAYHSFQFHNNIFLSPGLFSTAEKAADYLVIALTASAACFLHATNAKRRLYYGAAITFQLLAIIATGRRGPLYIGVLALTLVLLTPPPLWHSLPRPKRRVLPPIFTALVIIVVFTLVSPTQLKSYLTAPAGFARVAKTLTELPVRGLSVEGRGTGIASPGVDRLHTDARADPRDALLATLLQEVGVVGAALYAALLYAYIRRGCKRWRAMDSDAKALIFSALALLLIATKTHNSFNPQTQVFFWLMLGAAACADRGCTRDSRRTYKLMSSPSLPKPSV